MEMFSIYPIGTHDLNIFYFCKIYQLFLFILMHKFIENFFYLNKHLYNIIDYKSLRIMFDQMMHTNTQTHKQ